MRIADLQILLTSHGVDLSQYGTGEAKSVEHLARELESGEAVLIERDGQLVRQLIVLDVNVFADRNGKRYRLREDRQVFNDGRQRKRQIETSISEKIGPNEDLLVALRRAMQEELGIRLYYRLTGFKTSSTASESSSFPGLLSEYLIHWVDVLIDPDEYREEYVEHQEDKSTFFVWANA